MCIVPLSQVVCFLVVVVVVVVYFFQLAQHFRPIHTTTIKKIDLSPVVKVTGGTELKSDRQTDEDLQINEDLLPPHCDHGCLHTHSSSQVVSNGRTSRTPWCVAACSYTKYYYVLPRQNNLASGWMDTYVCIARWVLRFD